MNALTPEQRLRARIAASSLAAEKYTPVYACALHRAYGQDPEAQLAGAIGDGFGCGEATEIAHGWDQWPAVHDEPSPAFMLGHTLAAETVAKHGSVKP